MKKLLLVISLTIIFPLFAGAFQCGFEEVSWHHNVGKSLDRWIVIADQLNLSQDQKDKIFNIILNTKRSIDSISSDIMNIRYEKKKELSLPNPGWSKAKSYNDQISKLMASIHKVVSDAYIDILSTLTKEQREELKVLTRKRLGMWFMMEPKFEDTK